MTKTILVTNDDGIHSEGLHILCEVLRKHWDIKVIVPDRERSAISHSFSMHIPIRARTLKDDTVITDGTPTDCVMFGALGYLSRKPDFVVSGINPGPNMGDDVSYSGTASAALEGSMLGIQSVAVSLNTPYGYRKDVHYHYETAAQITCKILEKLKDNPLPKRAFLNINVPNLPLSEIKGLAITKLGARIYRDRVIKRIDPQGSEYFWIGGEQPSYVKEKGSDFDAIENNKVSITPLKMDFTDQQLLQVLSHWAENW